MSLLESVCNSFDNFDHHASPSSSKFASFDAEKYLLHHELKSGRFTPEKLHTQGLNLMREFRDDQIIEMIGKGVLPAWMYVIYKKHAAHALKDGPKAAADLPEHIVKLVDTLLLCYEPSTDGCDIEDYYDPVSEVYRGWATVENFASLDPRSAPELHLAVAMEALSLLTAMASAAQVLF
eukprot:gene16384-14234_t